MTPFDRQLADPHPSLSWEKAREREPSSTFIGTMTVAILQHQQEKAVWGKLAEISFVELRIHTSIK